MSIATRIILGLKQPGEIVEWLLRHPYTGRFVSDKEAVSIMYRLRFHRKMDWENPQTFNEKLLWLTVYDRKPLYSKLVDKYEAKRWMSQTLAEGGIV